MIILGISDSHEGHACIVKDGELLGVVAEERLSRLKADEGYPRRAIDRVLEMTNTNAADIDRAAFSCTRAWPFLHMLKYGSLFKKKEWIKQNHEYWGPKLIEGKNLTAREHFEMFRYIRGDDLVNDPYYPFLERINGKSEDEYSSMFRDLRKEVLSEHIGINQDKIHFYRHEDCHKTYGYYSSPYRNERALVLTIEGGGDDSSATASIMSPSGTQEYWKSNEVQIGRLYKQVTLLLGMQPGQHEYKVMGLAPYSVEYHGKRSREFFRTINKVVGIEIQKTQTVPDLYLSVRDVLEGERFDGIAWGLQEYVEEVLCEWVANNCRAQNTDTVILSGGVAQNIKACKKLIELPEVKRFWVGPVSGDGSLGVGAAWLATREFTPEVTVQGLGTVYLGTSYDAGQIDDAIAKNQDGSFTRFENPTPDQVAEWIDDGKVVARFSGRMEFGQRALGNRTIMADPRRHESVKRINDKIKFRDFWMPFTPSMMFEEVERFIENPKEVYSPYMCMAFDLKEGFEETLPAVIHPADKTVRPQMLRREDNPGYYDILAALKRRIGLGVVLNTSFNLHGDPIVESPEDAIYTFKNSDLDVVLFDHVAILRTS